MNNKTKQYKRSKFNTAASRRGMDAEEFASMVLANPSEYSQETINKAKYMLPKYGIGGDIFGGAASGIGAGAAFGGPVGAAIGGVAGAVGGLFSGKKREREERKAMEKQRKTNMANSARQSRFAEMQSEEQYNYAPVFAYGGYMENPPTGMRTVLDETTVTNEGKVQGDFYKPASTVTTSNYQPITRRTYYLENKRAGIIPESVTFEKFNKDFDKYSPKSEDYKYDQKSGKLYKNFPETQITEEDMYNYRKLGVKPPKKGRYVSAGNIQIKMAYGGNITGIPNVEVEGEESIQMPNGESFMPQGPSHAQGGIPMELPNNTRVFSKKLNVPGTKNKFSEIHDKTSKKIKNYEDTIDDPYATPVAKQTAKRMIDKLRNKQDVLFETQQALNGNNNNNNQMLPKAEKGIRVGNSNPTHADLIKFINDSYDERKRNYATIGNKEPDWEKLLEQQRQVTLSRANSPEIINNPNSWNKIMSAVSIMQPMKPKGISTINLTTKPVDTKTLAKMPTAAPAPKSGNFGNTVTGIAQALPAVYNIAQGLFGKADTLNANDYTNPYEGAAIKVMQNRKYNIDPMLEANRVAYSTANRNLASAARTRGELLSGYGASAYGKSMADMQAWATKNNEENRYAGDTASIYANLGQQRASNQMYVSDYNARARAAKQNLIGTGITQVGQLAQNYALNRNRSKADEMRTKALQHMYSNYNFNPTTGEWEVK